MKIIRIIGELFVLLIVVPVGWVIGKAYGLAGRIHDRRHLMDKERKEFYAGTEKMTIPRVMCCKCGHVGQKLECRGCGHHICLECKEPN